MGLGPDVCLGIDIIGSSGSHLRCRLTALPIFANTIRDIYELGEFQAGDETIILSERTDWPTSQGIVEIGCRSTIE